MMFVQDCGHLDFDGRSINKKFHRCPAGAHNTTYGGSDDAFVAKLNAPTSSLLYATYSGESSHDVGFGIAVDGTGDAYVTGYTLSAEWATARAYNPTYHGGTYDAFVVKFCGLAELFPGDTNGDGKVDFQDLVALAQITAARKRSALRATSPAMAMSTSLPRPGPNRPELWQDGFRTCSLSANNHLRFDSTPAATPVPSALARVRLATSYPLVVVARSSSCRKPIAPTNIPQMASRGTKVRFFHARRRVADGFESLKLVSRGFVRLVQCSGYFAER